MICSHAQNSYQLTLTKPQKSNEKATKVLILACSLYGLNKPNAILEGYTNDFLMSNTFTLEQIEDALKLNLMGKFGKVVKVFGSEVSALFFSEVLIEYQKYLDDVIYEATKNKEIERMQNEKIKAEKQAEIDRENFKNDTIAQFKAKTLIPRFYHWRILIENNLIIEDKQRLETAVEMIKNEIPIANSSIVDFMGINIPKEENILNRAKELYIKIEMEI